MLRGSGPPLPASLPSASEPSPPEEALGGFLNMLKPPGMTSHDVVARVRHLVGCKVGHLGTLDPPAAGVLPLALGAATRLQGYLPAARKAYRAEVLFGVETDTLDTTGQVLARRDPGALSREALEEACEAFQGVVWQTPPRVSALRVGGRRGHERVRQGEAFELPPREALYHRVAVLAVEPPRAWLEVDCGPGTYIRALARDLGERLGCGAALSFLLRTASGLFTLERALTLEEVQQAAARGEVAARVISPERLFEQAGLARVRVSLDRWMGGQVSPAELRRGRLEVGAAALVEGLSGEWMGLGTLTSADPPAVRLERGWGRFA